MANSVLAPGEAVAPQAGYTALFLLRIFTALYTFLIVISGMVPQAEMAIFGGKIPLPQSNSMLLALFCIVVFTGGGRFKGSPLIFATALLTAYALVDLCILIPTTQYSFGDLWASRRPYLIPLITVGVSCSIPLRIRSRYLNAMVGTLFVACIALSAAQLFLNDPIVATTSLDGAFAISALMFMGHIRAFSFFGSGLSAGIFYCFTGSIATSLALDKRLRTRALGIVMLAMSGFGVYATLTRLTLVGFCFSVIAVLVLRLVKAPIITNWMPLGWGIAAIAVIGATILAPGGGSRADIASTSSMAERLFEWGIFGAKFVSGSFSNMVFGSAVTPYKPLTVLTMPATSATIPIDNGYLEVLLNSGLVGLGLVIYFYKQCWIAICEKSRTTKSHLLQGTAAFFSVLPFFAGINDLPSEFFMIFAFAMYFEN